MRRRLRRARPDLTCSELARIVPYGNAHSVQGSHEMRTYSVIARSDHDRSSLLRSGTAGATDVLVLIGCCPVPSAGLVRATHDSHCVCRRYCGKTVVKIASRTVLLNSSRGG